MKQTIVVFGILATVGVVALTGGAALVPPARAEFGIAMHDSPKYGADLAHFDYVDADAPKGGTIRLAVLGSFDSLNPFIIKGAPAAGLRDYVYETLLARSYDEPFSLYGLLAESVDTPPDRSSVTFQIRPQARFSDGSPVTPEDVLFSWRLLKEKGRPNHRSSYAKVAAAEKVGERGVKFTFEGSDREMPLIMGLMPVLSRRAFTPESFDKTTFEKPLATGPYVVDAIEPGAGIVYRRNPDYWGRDLPLMRGQYNFDIIRIDYYRDSTTLYEALQRGLVDVEGDSDSIDAARWAEADGIPAVRAGLLNKLEFSVGVPAPMAGLVFNTRRAPFEDRRVREALTLLFDFEWINKTLFRGLYTRTESYFDRSELSSHGRAADARERALLAPYANEVDPAVMDGTFSEPASDGSGTNREARKRAIALFAEAGYSLREGRMVRTATGEPLAFEMTCVSPEQERLMLAYSRFLRQAGVASSVRIVDSAQYQRRATSFDFDMIQATWASSLSPGNEQSFRWSEAAAFQEGSFNYAGVRSKAADAMIAAMLNATTRADFVSAVRALDRVLVSGRYAIPLYHTENQWILAWSHIRRPSGSTLYGARLETWWDANASAAVAGRGDGAR